MTESYEAFKRRRASTIDDTRASRRVRLIGTPTCPKKHRKGCTCISCPRVTSEQGPLGDLRRLQAEEFDRNLLNGTAP